ncbi:hypothetical protein ACM9HF_05385 [Colwellia sp. RE-S-Sl-9]
MMIKTKLMKSTRTLISTSVLAVGLTHSANAAEFFDGRVDAKVLLMQGYQSIEANAGAFENINTNMSSGFQRLRFNIELAVKINDYVTAYADLGEEPNDFGSDDQFEISQDLAYIDLDILGLADKADENTQWLFRAGNIVSTVFDYRGYSDGAAVQKNPLIGNSPIDFVTAESGIQTLWSKKIMGSTITKVNADVGLSVPTFFEDYGSDKGYNVFGRASINTNLGLDVGLGWFVSDLGDQVASREFANIQTAGLIQGDGDNYNFVSSGTNSRDTHAGLLPGLNANILQINAQYQASASTLLRAWAGIAKDDYSFVDSNGKQTVASKAIGYQEIESKIHYYAIEATQYIKPESLYLATRYSSITNASDGVSGDKDLTRFQVGLGWWVASGTLVKAEYVKQSEGNASAGQIGSDWDGITAEISVFFD